MSSLFADEDFHERVVEVLATLGHDVLTTRAAGLADQGVKDSQILAFASAQGRAVLTHNRRHYFHLHSTAQPHSGIIVCTRDDADPTALASRIDLAIAGLPMLDNLLVRIQRPSVPRSTP